MFSRLLILIGLVAAGLLLFIITTVAPVEAGAAGILAVFVLSYVVILCGLTFIIWLLILITEKVGKNIRIFRKMTEVSLVKAYYYSSVISLGIIIMISLRSVGTIGIYEYALILLFVLLGCIYVAKRTR